MSATLLRIAGLLASLALLSCGPRLSPEPNATYFWQIKSSTVEFGACSDLADFRADITPVEVSENSFLIYKVSADGATAPLQKCNTLDSKTCSDSESGIVFSVTGRELTYSETKTSPLGTSGCSLQENITWTVTDSIQTMNLDISNVLTLVNSPAACANVEDELKAQSPNMLGVEGCVISYKLSGVIR